MFLYYHCRTYEITLLRFMVLQMGFVIYKKDFYKVKKIHSSSKLAVVSLNSTSQFSSEEHFLTQELLNIKTFPRNTIHV